MTKEKKPKNEELEEELTTRDTTEESETVESDEKTVPEKTAEELAEEYLNDLKRLQADFENYKKRQAESQKELAGYLIEKLLFDIIPVLDNFRMATGHVPEDAKDSPWVTGIQYIEKQLEDALRSHGVEVMEVKEGDVFDPSIHEAISGEATSRESRVASRDEEKSEMQDDEETEQRQETVAKVLQNGYRIGGRVVRPAKVTVK